MWMKIISVPRHYNKVFNFSFNILATITVFIIAKSHAQACRDNDTLPEVLLQEYTLLSTKISYSPVQNLENNHVISQEFFWFWSS